MGAKQRYIWLDVLKIFACFFVIINHSHGLLFEISGYTQSTVTFDAIFFSICKIAVPLFVMTTGYLTLQKEISYKKTFLRIVRILVPLVLFSAHYYCYYNKENANIINFITKSVANPQNIALWYLYMLMGLYLVIPFITKIVMHSSQRDLSFFMLAFLIAPPALYLIAKEMDHTINSYIFSSFFHISVCYLVAGIYLSRLKLKFSLFITSIVLFVASEIPVIMGIINTFKTTGEMVYAFDNWSSLPVIVSSISFFYIIRYLFENISPKKKLSKFIQQVSATTFGIYLIHNLAINLLFELQFVKDIFQINSFVVLIVFQIVVFAICSVIIFILKKIPGVKWFL
ncbi:MAG: acyltransferase family protein [Clostridia bacterium]|nr:acyltransferase family protein [Clostridia bacterium]